MAVLAGTYSNLTGLRGESDCISCPGGYYCDSDGLTGPSGLCGEGYYCPEGSSEREPADKFCPIGNYCPEGVSQPIPCRNNSYVRKNIIKLLRCDIIVAHNIR